MTPCLALPALQYMDVSQNRTITDLLRPAGAAMQPDNKIWYEHFFKLIFLNVLYKFKDLKMKTVLTTFHKVSKAQKNRN